MEWEAPVLKTISDENRHSLPILISVPSVAARWILPQRLLFSSIKILLLLSSMHKSPSVMCTFSAISIVLLSPQMLILQFFNTPDQFLLHYYGHRTRYDSKVVGHIIRFCNHPYGYDLETVSYLKWCKFKNHCFIIKDFIWQSPFTHYGITLSSTHPVPF